jgi:hypothetical protein
MQRTIADLRAELNHVKNQRTSEVQVMTATIERQKAGIEELIARVRKAEAALEVGR